MYSFVSVDDEGKMAQLTDLSFEKDEVAETPADRADKKSKKPKDEEVSTNPEISNQEEEKSKPEDEENLGKELDLVKAPLSEIVGEDHALRAVEMLKYWADNTNKDASSGDKKDKNVTFPMIDDKQKRKDLHMLIRGPILSKFALADTIDKCVRVWHKLFETEMPNYGNFQKTPDRNNGSRNNNNNNKRKRENILEWPKDRPNFLQFVLYKENVDTATACKDVSVAAKLPPRGKGSITYAGMKDKRGVTSQFCTVFRKTAAQIAVVNKRRSSGGGNSSKGAVDVVRVGNFQYVSRERNLGRLGGNRFDIVLRNIDPCIDSTDASKEVRLEQATKLAETAATAMKEAGFVNYFGMQRFGKYFDTHLVGIEMMLNNFEGAVNIIMQVKPDEPPFAHNARVKWQQRFDDESITDKKKAEQDCARIVKKDLTRFMTSELKIMDHLMRRPLDYRGAILSLPTGMMLMYLHGLQSFLWNKTVSHRIKLDQKNVIVGDLVLVENKSYAEGGSGTSGLKGKEVALVTEEDVQMKKYTLADVVIPMPGGKVQFPNNSAGKYMEKLIGDLGLTRQSFKHQCKELTLGGDYRLILCRPHDFEYKIIQYTDPVQPLMATDLMNCNGEELVQKREGALLGMVVGLTLPPSSYATIALRELTRRPTAAEYQKELQLEGACERNVLKLKPPTVPNVIPKKNSESKNVVKKAAAIVVGSTMQ